MWYVYMVQCRDGSLYTGITTDVDRRIRVHNNGTGAKALLGKRPVVLAYVESVADKSAAGRRERKIKQLKRQEKLQIIRCSSFSARCSLPVVAEPGVRFRQRVPSVPVDHR